MVKSMPLRVNDLIGAFLSIRRRPTQDASGGIVVGQVGNVVEQPVGQLISQMREPQRIMMRRSDIRRGRTLSCNLITVCLMKSVRDT